MSHPSLLPYLNGSDAAFRLELPAVAGELQSGSIPPRFPFEIISDDGGALSRILGARVTSDAGSLVRPVFLMLSRDDHVFPENALSPLNNADIDSIWKKTFKAHEKDDSLIALSVQVPGQEGPVPFRSLFFCSKTRTFFHPVCPGCGHELDLCRDDGILKNSGLKPYSTSLKRYLACPSCIGNGSQEVFYSSAPGPEDPACVKGPHELIAGFVRASSGDLPCARCPERASCLSDGQAGACITPVAFYPFYLLMFEAATLNAFDFLSLVSGADDARLENRLDEERRFARKRLVSLFLKRGGPKALFSGHDREFLEILYLKIAFLGETARYLLSGGKGLCRPGTGPCLEGLWLRMPDQSGLLPGFWNFRLAFMDLGLHDSLMLPLAGTDYACRVLGVLWFHALLRNSAQDAGTINRALGPALNGMPLETGDAVFSPGNIFWEPGPVPKAWLPLWEKTLQLGATLLASAGRVANPAEELLTSCRALLQEVRQELFAAGPVYAEALSPREDEKAGDERIGAVLDRITLKWSRAEAPEEPEPAQPAVPDHEPEKEIRAEEAEQASGSIPAGRDEPLEDEEYTETVVLKAPRLEADPEGVENDFTTETIIVQDVRNIRDVPEEAPREEPPASLEHTVIMGGGPSSGPVRNQDEDEKPGSDDLEATVIMGVSPPSTPLPQQKRPAAQDDDGLTETVVMGPGKKS